MSEVWLHEGLLRFLEAKEPEILVSSRSSKSARIIVRGYTRHGFFEHPHQTNSDRSEAVTTFRLPGLPISLNVITQTSNLRRGECYVAVVLRMAGVHLITLCQGYVAYGADLSWPPTRLENPLTPPGRPKIISFTNPAAGSEAAVTVPTNAYWKLKILRLALTTDATAVDRRVRLLIDDGANVIFETPGVVAQAASLTRTYVYIPGYPVNETDFDLFGVIRRPLPPEILLPQGWRLRTSTVNLQAGDQFLNIFAYVEEWIEE